MPRRHAEEFSGPDPRRCAVVDDRPPEALPRLLHLGGGGHNIATSSSYTDVVSPHLVHSRRPWTHTFSQQAPLCVWWTQFTGAAWAAGTAETNSEMAIETTATAMERRIKRGMVSGSLSFSELVVMGRRAFVQERALAKWACSLVAPTVKDQRYITPGAGLRLRALPRRARRVG